MPRISIIILNWNGYVDTVECVDSLMKINYPSYEIIIVDNASKGNDIDILRKHFGQHIRIIRNSENLGFAKGNNVAIKLIMEEKKSDYILLLNNDTVVEKDFLKELVNVAESGKNTAIVGPKMYYYNYNGSKNVIWFGGGKIDWKRNPGYHHIDQYKADTNSVIPVKVGWISGACFMMNVRRISPLLDESYFFGCEDVDKCIKVAKKGFDIYYVPNSIIWHKVSQSRLMKKFHKLQNHLTEFKLVARNNRNWMFLIPYYSIIILSDYIQKNIRKQFKNY